VHETEKPIDHVNYLGEGSIGFPHQFKFFSEKIMRGAYMSGTERKLASVRVVSGKAVIEGADFIEVVILDGWQCIVKKGET